MNRSGKSGTKKEGMPKSEMEIFEKDGKVYVLAHSVQEKLDSIQKDIGDMRDEQTLARQVRKNHAILLVVGIVFVLALIWIKFPDIKWASLWLRLIGNDG